MDGITKILTTIKVSKGGSVRVASSDAEREGEANIVTFNPATETNITNPLNGETIAVSGRVGDSQHRETQLLFTEKLILLFTVLRPGRGHSAGPNHVEDQA